MRFIPSTSDSTSPQVLIVGFGAVGIIYGYLLETNGNVRVTAVARSKYDRIIERGIDVQSEKWGTIKEWRPYRVVRDIRDVALEQFDYVFICTKAIPEVVSTAEILEPFINQTLVQPTYVLLQNGLGVEDDLYAALKKKSPNSEPMIVSCALYIMANVQDDGSVFQTATDKVVIGVYKGQDRVNKEQPFGLPGEQGLLERLTDLLNKSGLEASYVADIAAAKFIKNLWNASIGMVSCLTRLNTKQWDCSPLSLETSYGLVEDMLTEIVAVGRAIGYDESILPQSIIQEKIQGEIKRASASDTSGKFDASALLDIKSGKPFELEVILGAVVRMAHRNNCPVPVSRLVLKVQPQN
ncbi:ApbA-domain-containing protein [Serendipita vermifera]|nr:ApbA-domain-containing protein [Serendipita vermifera]